MTTASFWMREGEESKVLGARDGDNIMPFRAQNAAF